MSLELFNLETFFFTSVVSKTGQNTSNVKSVFMTFA